MINRRFSRDINIFSRRNSRRRRRVNVAPRQGQNGQLCVRRETDSSDVVRMGNRAESRGICKIHFVEAFSLAPLRRPRVSESLRSVSKEIRRNSERDGARSERSNANGRTLVRENLTPDTPSIANFARARSRSMEKKMEITSKLECLD